MSEIQVASPAVPASRRRRFLTGATAVAAGAAATAVAMPNVSRAQTVTLKMQGAWGAKDIFNDSQAYVARVNEMSGGRLVIEYLIAGAVVKPFSIQDAVNDGVLDGGHHVTAYWLYGKNKAASCSAPARSGAGTRCGSAWIHQGGGQALYDELIQQVLGLNIVGFFALPMPTQPWLVQDPAKSADDLKGLKYRTVGLAADVMQAMGMAVAQYPGGEILPAMERGVIDAFEFNNPTSDRRFGAQDVSKNYVMSSYHQATEYFEIIFNKTKYDSLPQEHQAILKYAAEAASTANFATAMDNYSNDLEWLQTSAGSTAPDRPLDPEGPARAWDKVLPA